MLSRLFGSPARRTSTTRIAFDRTSNRNVWQQNEIFMIDPDGANGQRIRQTGKYPRWSPDGQWVTFLHETKDNDWLPSLLVIDANGERGRQMTNQGGLSATAPTWWPDSTHLVFTLWFWEERRHQVFRIDLDKDGPAPMTEGGNCGDPVWLPSNRMVLNCSDDVESRLYAMISNGENRRKWTLFEPDDFASVWMHDGRYVVFRRDDEVLVMTWDGRDVRRFYLNYPSVSQNIISPAGGLIAFSANDGAEAGFEIYMKSLEDGFEQKVVAYSHIGSDESSSYELSWSPDL